MPNGRPPKYNWDVIRQLAATGTPLPAICQQLHVDYNTLKSRAKREGWKITQTFGRAPKTNPKQTFHLVQKSAKAIIDSNGLASRVHLSGAIRKASATLEAMPENELLEKSSALDAVSRSAARVHTWNQDQQLHELPTINIALLSAPPEKFRIISEPDPASRPDPPPRELEP